MLPLCPEDFLLDSTLRGGETQQVDCFLQMPAGDHHGGRTHLMELRRRGSHFVEIRHLQPGEHSGLIHIRSDHIGERDELLDEQPGSGRIQKVCAGG